MPIPLFDKLISAFGGPYADAQYVAVDNTEFNGIFNGNSNIQQSLRRVDATQLGAPISLRSDDSFVLSGGNSNQWFNREIRFNAATNLFRTLTLPNRPAVTAALAAQPGRSYPFRITISYTGGTSDDITVNRLRITPEGGASGIPIAGRGAIVLSRGEAVVFELNSDTDEFVVLSEALIAAPAATPLGTVVLQADTWDASNTSGLPTVNVQDGYAYEVSGAANDGTEVFTGVTVFNGDWAVWNNSTFTQWSDTNNWFVIPSSDVRRMIQDNDAFLTQVTRTGNRYDLSRSVFINPSNVAITTNTATGLPLTYNYQTDFNEGGGATARTRTFTNQNIQFADIVGGRLTLMIRFDTNSQSGTPPDLGSLIFDYGSITFTFPLDRVNPDAGVTRVDITIPEVDYTSAINANCTVTFNFEFRGDSYNGSFTVSSLVNTQIGTLHDAIVALADAEARKTLTELQPQIDNINASLQNEEGEVQAILPRISPYLNISNNIPDVNAWFLDSTGSDSFPTAITQLTQVDTDSPQFEAGNVALYVALLADRSNYTLRNVTTGNDLAIVDSDPAVTLGESLTYQNQAYFVYRITGITATNIYEIDKQISNQVVKWQYNIDNLQAAIARIDAELSHALLDLPEALVQVLQHQVTVDEETTPVIAATDYNVGLGNTGSQTVFYETSPNAGSGGTKVSKPYNEPPAARRGNKLVYYPVSTTYTNTNYFWANDGTTNRDLIVYEDGSFFAVQFIAATSSGSTTVIVYPTPANAASGANIWQTINALTIINGIPQPEADELYFVNNIPTQSTTLTIQYRFHQNGTLVGANSTTLAGVGGGSDVSTTFTYSSGGEQATVQVRYYASTRLIRVSIDEQVYTGLPTIDDVQVILSYSETRTIPGIPAHTRNVNIESLDNINQVFATRVSSTNTLIVVGSNAEVDTNYNINTLFNTTNTGTYVARSEGATFLDYQDFSPISTTVADLQNHASLPQFGLFTTSYTHETTVEWDTQMTVKNSQDDTVRVGQELVLVAPNSTRWRLSVQNDGTLVTTQVT